MAFPAPRGANRTCQGLLEQCYLGESSLKVTLKKIYDFMFSESLSSVVLLEQDSQLKFVSRML